MSACRWSTLPTDERELAWIHHRVLVRPLGRYHVFPAGNLLGARPMAWSWAALAALMYRVRLRLYCSFRVSLIRSFRKSRSLPLMIPCDTKTTVLPSRSNSAWLRPKRLVWSTKSTSKRSRAASSSTCRNSRRFSTLRPLTNSVYHRSPRPDHKYRRNVAHWSFESWDQIRHSGPPWSP